VSEEKSGYQENIAIGQRIQEKFDLYILGLIFTTLALSIQTAKFAGPATADVAELVSWLLFLVAGLAGLSRLEYVPEIYRLAGLLALQNDKASGADVAKSQGAREFTVAGTGTTIPVDDYTRRAREDASRLEAVLKPHHRMTRTKYRAMKAAFILGLVTLIFARGYAPIQRLAHAGSCSSQPASPQPVKP
jgi:hypothetical protein